MTLVIDHAATILTARTIMERKSSSSSGAGGGTATVKLKSLSKQVAKKMVPSGASASSPSSAAVSSPAGTSKKIVVTRIRETIVESSDVFRLCEKKKYVSLVVSSGENGDGGGDGHQSTHDSSSERKRKVEATADDGGSADVVAAEDEDEADRKRAKKEKKRRKKDKKKKSKKEKRSGGGGDGASDDKTNTSMTTAADVRRWRKDNKIIVLEEAAGDGDDNGAGGNDAGSKFAPYPTFDAAAAAGNDLLAAPLLQHCVGAHDFVTPSPIQAQCWPVLAAGRDVIGIAETGSGKTLAFALPALSTMRGPGGDGGKPKNRGRRPRMLVLAPTRELAMQSNVVLEDFGKQVGATSLVVYGGVPKHVQARSLSKGIDCLVATPGRLVDLIHDGAADLGDVRHLVLDEADRMLDMGFAEDVRFIINQCPAREDRQTAMFSATWPAAVRKLAAEYMVDPVRVYVGFEAIVGSGGDGDGDADAAGGVTMVDDSLSANKRVAQTVEVIEDRAREGRLEQLLRRWQTGKCKGDLILVFALYKKEAERLEYSLQRKGWNCSSIHGNKTQEARTKALAEFKNGTSPLLIATDVAARGLDIPNVKVVINFTFPLTIEDYVHRIGRTGRAGKTGISHTFFQHGDKSHAGELQQVMRQAGQAVPEELLAFGSTIKKKEHKLYGNFGPQGGGGRPMKEATKIKFSYSDDEE